MSQHSETTSALCYSFKGKRILITGGGKGVGRALVERLYKDGASVFTLEKDASLVEELRKEFPNARAETADVSNWKQTQQLIESFGPVDHLINNAGIILFDDFIKITEDHVDSLMNVNLKSVYCTSQTVARGMIAEGIHGSIVSIASVGSHFATTGGSVYCVTKAGVRMLTKCMAYELGKYNIRVNSVSPTCIDTPMYRANAHELPDEVEPFFNRQPLAGRKVLTADEVVDSVLFLLSPLSSMATGTDLLIDGGCFAC